MNGANMTEPWPNPGADISICQCRHYKRYQSPIPVSSLKSMRSDKIESCQVQKADSGVFRFAEYVKASRPYHYTIETNNGPKSKVSLCRVVAAAVQSEQ